MTDRGAHILILDDEPSIRGMLSFALSQKGHQIRLAATNAEALLIVKNDPVDLVICDVSLSGANGLDVLKTFRTYVSDLEVIVITGFPNLESTLHALRLGAFDYIAKPFELEQMYAAVEGALEHQRLGRGLLCAEEINRLQYEMLQQTGSEFEASIRRIMDHARNLLAKAQDVTAQRHMQNIEKEAGSLLQRVEEILNLPKRISGRQPGAGMEWSELLHKLSCSNKTKLKASVLVVDDDPGILELLDYMLTREGYAVQTASDGQTALDLLQSHPPDFLLLDLMMPKLNGFELLEAIRPNPALQDLPIFILTAKHLTPGERGALQNRAAMIIQKGETDIGQIVSVLNEHCGKFRTLSIG